MLVISRKRGQEIMIGDDIVIVVKKVTPTLVSVGISAPKETKIVRGELRPKPGEHGCPLK